MRLVKIPDVRAKKPKKTWLIIKALALVVAIVLVINICRPLPNATIELFTLHQPRNAVTLAWPGNGTQAAVGTESFGLLDTHGEQKPIATASIAKVITALCVLQKHPLQKGQQGPKIVLSSSDYALYQSQLNGGGSNLPIYIGEELTEYQALQALMIPSANNIADTLAIWAFGDMETYHKYANTYVRNLGMSFTTISGDASGYDPATKSTAQDLIKLGLAALKNPVLMEIAGQRSATFPLVGQLDNYNKALGKAGINGLKTGNNLENLGGLLFSFEMEAFGQKIPAVGAVLGAEDLPTALDYSEELASSLPAQFTEYQTGKSIVGTARTAWGASATIREVQRRRIVHYKGTPLIRRASVFPVSGVHKHTPVGTVVYSAGVSESTSRLEIADPAPSPSLWWRATRLF